MQSILESDGWHGFLESGQSSIQLNQQDHAFVMFVDHLSHVFVVVVTGGYPTRYVIAADGSGMIDGTYIYTVGFLWRILLDNTTPGCISRMRGVVQVKGPFGHSVLAPSCSVTDFCIARQRGVHICGYARGALQSFDGLLTSAAKTLRQSAKTACSAH